jgi:hypothetical protein
MPEQESPTTDQNSPEQESAEGGRGASILSKLYVVGFLGAVVVMECAIAYLYIPTASETAAMAGVAPVAGPESDASFVMDQPDDTDLEDQLEVDLGEFSLTAFQPLTDTTLRIDFRLYGTIHIDDKMKFDQAWQQATHRIRDQVITTVRSSELTELTDAGLGLIKRKILEKTNRTLGTPLLQAVIFSDFSFIEQ